MGTNYMSGQSLSEPSSVLRITAHPAEHRGTVQTCERAPCVISTEGGCDLIPKKLIGDKILMNPATFQLPLARRYYFKAFFG